MVTPLRTILESVTKTWKLEPAAQLASAREKWEMIAGPAIAAASVPLSLRSRRLVVGVVHPAVGQEIKLRHAEIVTALARELGSDAVIAVLPVHRRSLSLPGRHVKRRS